MKADISTLHKPDILTLQRHGQQIRCVVRRRSVRCANRGFKFGIPTRTNIVHLSIPKVGLALLCISVSVWAAQDPLMGTWKLNLSKSTYIARAPSRARTRSPGPPPKSSLNTYGPHGQDGFTYDAV